MRTIRTKVYKFNELSEEAKKTAILKQIDFEIEMMDENSPYIEVAEEMKKMQTPWFLAETLFFEHSESIIENIIDNGYEFYANGKMI